MSSAVFGVKTGSASVIIIIFLGDLCFLQGICFVADLTGIDRVGVVLRDD